MKRYFLYAIILGCLGHSLLSNASSVPLTNKNNSALEQMGE